MWPTVSITGSPLVFKACLYWCPQLAPCMQSYEAAPSMSLANERAALKLAESPHRRSEESSRRSEESNPEGERLPLLAVPACWLSNASGCHPVPAWPQPKHC